MDMLTIGKMAKLNNISDQALRLYDRIGLLKPYYIDEQTGYRYYNIKQCARLDMIQYMKELGMSLKQIKEHLDRQDISVIQEVLKRQKQLINEKIAELNQKQKAIIRSIESYYRYAASPREGVIVIEHLPQRKIYCYNCGINIYEHELDTYEYMLRELKSHILLHDLPMIYFCNVGSIIRKNMLEARKLVSNEIFLFVDDDFEANKGVEIIHAGTFASIYFESFSFYKEKKYADILLEHIAQNNYRIVGDYICEVIAELPIFPQNERNMFVRLQIPIEFR
ncbi:MAG: MerR family transcriptional regulator [Tepidanaerobacteraceae bacterium]|nr:MerR family transcriptional regulator [Tepidanaerobacteraceae bacterium]